MAHAKLTDEQIERFKRLAWPELAGMLRVARHLTSQQAEAEDLVQEAMIKAMRAINRFQDGTDIRAWLLTILRRTQIDRVRAARIRGRGRGAGGGPGVEVSLEDDLVAAPDVADADGSWSRPQDILNQFEDQAVIDALQALPQEIRWTLLLVDVEQLDQAAAAAILDVPVGTIKSRVHRGRKMLHDRLLDLARQRGWLAAAGRRES